MRVMNYVYYCLYRFVLKTPLRVEADAWPGVFLALTLCIHALTIYFFYTLLADSAFGPRSTIRMICIVGMVLILIILYWYYVWMENAARVIREYEKRGNDKKYARLGAIILFETALLPLGLSGILILTQKLTGWPPHP